MTTADASRDTRGDGARDDTRSVRQTELDERFRHRAPVGRRAASPTTARLPLALYRGSVNIATERPYTCT